jgi:superfamily II DNA or RNA helicase
MRTIRFDRGTLVLEDFPPDEVPEGFLLDPRVGFLRGHAMHYGPLVRDLHGRGVAWNEEARTYGALSRTHTTTRTPRDYQREAVEAWRSHDRCGVVVLPTGSGKTFVAELCIADADRDTLVVAPTIDLVGQWYDVLRQAFGEPVGVLGGGVHEVHPITVATYDSAYLHMERYGARFGMVVFDEVHHLPGPSYSGAAEACLAPFRLGLTATLERTDGQHEGLLDWVGPVVYRKSIKELSGDFLAEYTTEIVKVALSPEEQEAYEAARSAFRTFCASRGLRLGGPGGWGRFLREAARSNEGRRALAGWRESRRILQGNEAKLGVLEHLLRKHVDRRCIVFTNDNDTVYTISRRLLLPAITHQTDVKERRRYLEAFSTGELPVLVTSRVLNEGVDLPSADIAIVLSGTGTVREHVQRLGRILRRREGKQALLYELVVEGSAEENTSKRRRNHEAYR